jgi:cobalt-zinc-cadmium resistance protein CzcA
MPPSISLEKGQDILLEVRRRILAFPEVRKTLSEQGRPEDGTDNEGVNMSETFIRLKPVGEWRPGWNKKRLIHEMRASLSEIPGVRYNFSQPMRDNIEEAVSGVRGKVVLKVFGPDLTRMRATLEQAKDALKTVPGIVDLDLYRDASTPQLQVRFNRQALARGGVRWKTRNAPRNRFGGRVVTTMWEENARPYGDIAIGDSRRSRKDRRHYGRRRGRRTYSMRDLATLQIASGLASINRKATVVTWL